MNDCTDGMAHRAIIMRTRLSLLLNLFRPSSVFFSIPSKDAVCDELTQLSYVFDEVDHTNIFLFQFSCKQSRLWTYQRTFIFFGMKFPSWYSIRCKCKPNASIKYCGCGSQILLDWLRYWPVIRCSGTFPWMSAKKSKQQKYKNELRMMKTVQRENGKTTRIQDMMK